jgi:dCMP deaminase
MNQKELDLIYMKEAYRVGSRFSTDYSTQNGAIITYPYTNKIVSFGANYFPDKVKETPERWERPLKYSYVEHAERNAIYQAASCGKCTNGCTMYCYWAACADCARAIIQSGIKRLVTHKIIMDISHERWKDTIELAFGMLREAGVQLDQVEDPIEEYQIRFNGELWTPNGKQNDQRNLQNLL